MTETKTSDQTPLDALREHVHTLDADPATDRVDLTHDIVVICPDDGKFVAFRGRCPKCGGESWVPAGALSREQLAMLDRVLGREAEHISTDDEKVPQPPQVAS